MRSVDTDAVSLTQADPLVLESKDAVDQGVDAWFGFGFSVSDRERRVEERALDLDGVLDDIAEGGVHSLREQKVFRR